MYLKKNENKDGNNNEKENAEFENTFENIFENIIEVNIDKEIKRRNSFNGKNIFNKKILKKNNNENSKMENNNQDKISSLLKEDNLYKFKNNENKRNKSKENSDLSNSSNINKIENENNNMNKKNNTKEKGSVSSSSFKNRNFILKSELNRLNNEVSNNQSKENVFDCLLTQKIKRQEELNKNQFYKFFFDNNAQEKINYQENNQNKINIISNTYLDEEENREKEVPYQLNEKDNSYDIIKALQKNNIIEEEYSIKNLLNSNINLKNEIKKENMSNNYKNNRTNIEFNKFNISNNNIKIENQIIDNKLNDNLYNQASNNQFKENKNLENNIINQEENKNSSNNPQSKEKNVYNLLQYNNQNNYINNIYNIQNPKTFDFKFVPGYYYYPLMQNPSIYNNNYKNGQAAYDNFYNNNQFFKSDNQFTNNKEMINNKIINNNSDNKTSINEAQNLAKASLNLVKSQVGCLVLQEKVISDNKFANELLFPELSNNLNEICCDLFGNYLIQVLLEILTPENLELFLSKTNDTLLDICLTEYGSRVVQKLINRIYDSPRLLNKLISSLKNKDIGALFKSPYANHMLQKYLTVVKKEEFNNFIYDYIYNHFLEVVKSKHGVCVVQRGLSEGNDEQKKRILEITLNNLDHVIKDGFANFLIQYIIIKYERKDFNEILPFLNKIEENIIDYCKFKFSASVIEKCFERGEQQVKEHIINNLLQYHSKQLIDIILNSFGIYVIKKALNVNNVNFKKTIRQIINENIDKIKESNNAVKIVENLAQNSQEYAYLINY